LKVQCITLLSNFAFNFNLRRYNVDAAAPRYSTSKSSANAAAAVAVAAAAAAADAATTSVATTSAAAAAAVILGAPVTGSRESLLRAQVDDVSLTVNGVHVALFRFNENTGDALTNELGTGASAAPAGRGLHSSTFRINVSVFCGIWGAFRSCLGVFSWCQGLLDCV
jgi:hypothetical protein